MIQSAARKTRAQLPSGGQRQWGYDAVSQIVTITDLTAGTALAQRFTFSYDGVGNRTVISDLDGALTTYAYDAKNRLTQDKTSGTNAHTYDYTYDPNDNRLTASENGLTTYTYDAANRLSTSQDSTGSSAYTYDANGNLTNVSDPTGLTTMTYDKENRLSVHAQGSTLTTYTYSGEHLIFPRNNGHGV